MTLEWWDDLWLNEGFASFMEYVGVNAIHPEWKMVGRVITQKKQTFHGVLLSSSQDEQFLVEDMQRVMMYDSEPSTRPVFTKVSNPDEINEIFDPISYSKVSHTPYSSRSVGSSLILRLKMSTGEEKPREWHVLSTFLNKCLLTTGCLP